MESVLFSDQMGRDLRWSQFLNTSLGRLHQAIPFDELARLFPPPSHTGRPAWMDVRGGIGLQVLKSYLGLSDEKLLDRLNTDWVLQYFCGIRLSPGQWIRDKDLVGRWRRYLSEHIDYAHFQLELAKHWRPLMKDTQAILMDATCYESHLRYPTDVKLLWECCEWLWELIDQCCKELKLAKPRRKQKKQFQRYLHYQKRRRKTHKKEKRQRRYLLRFLAKGLDEWAKLAGRTQIILAQKTYDRLQTIRLVYEQQQLHYDDPQAQIKDRIVSLAKTYIRPIVRGKETKRVEFGAKVHSVQIDGITFVEHLSYDAFNEGTRLESSVTLSQTYFERCRQLGAVYLNLDINHDKALEAYKRALPISEEINDLQAIATTSVNMGEIYLKREQLDTAMNFFQKAYETFTEYEGNESYALTNIGRVYVVQKNHQKAINYFQKAYDRAKELDAKFEMIVALNELG